jgi:guanylate kinase
MQEKLVIISAPSGAGKSTIVNAVLPDFPQLKFSISATSRGPRGVEKHGAHYYFFTPEEFKEAIAQDKFLEWEEVYPNQFYGSLKSEVQRLWNEGNAVIFDIDVMGGLNLKRQFGNKAISIFIQPPSEEALEERLRKRGTDSEEKIAVRLAKAKEELSHASQFDYVVVNDQLESATDEVRNLIANFLEH